MTIKRFFCHLTLFTSILAGLLGSLNASAGGMSSSGVERRWPWFEGPSQVFYCVNRPLFFSLPLPKARTIINQGIAIWVERVRNLTPAKIHALFPLDTKPEFALLFVEKACGQPEVSLRFELGRITQDVADIPMNLVPFDYVSINVKTGWNSATKKPQGFVWFAPDQGDKVFLTKRGKADFDWTPAIFEAAVEDELGWVFGFSQ